VNSENKKTKYQRGDEKMEMPYKAGGKQLSRANQRHFTKKED